MVTYLVRIKGLATTRNAKIVLLASIICLVAAPILGFAFKKFPIHEEGYDIFEGNEKTIIDNSTVTLSECFTQEFTLVKDQICYVELTVPYENITIYFILIKLIISKVKIMVKNKYFAGIDVGTSYIKMVIIDEESKIVRYCIERISPNLQKSISDVFNKLISAMSWPLDPGRWLENALPSKS